MRCGSDHRLPAGHGFEGRQAESLAEVGGQGSHPDAGKGGLKIATMPLSGQAGALKLRLLPANGERYRRHGIR